MADIAGDFESLENGDPATFKYKWDYETILEDVPGLEEYFESDLRLKKLNKRLGQSVVKLLKELNKEVNIVFGKKQNILKMRPDELKRISMDKLIDYYEVIGTSLIKMLRAGRLEKSKILALRLERDEDSKIKDDLSRKLKEERTQFQQKIKKWKNKNDADFHKLLSKEKKLQELLKENAKIKVDSKRQINEEKKFMRSMSNFRISKSIPFNEFNSLKKVLADEKFFIDNYVSKDKKIFLLNQKSLKKDQKIVKDSMENNILKIQVEKKNKEIQRLRSSLKSTQDELIKLKNLYNIKEKRQWKKEILSDDNPNYVDYYKKQVIKERRKNIDLRKKLKKYILQEKRVLVKEKAFEFERAENFRNVINLRNELQKEKLKNERKMKKNANYYG